MKPNYAKFFTDSDKETIKLGKRLGELLIEGDIVGLVGDLGSGKTWFAKGIALGLGVNQGIVITSPSFALINEYEGRYPFYHMDLYRLEDLSDLLSAGLEDYLYYNGVVAVEWADRWHEILPVQSIWIEFVIIDENRRNITLSGSESRAGEILVKLGSEL